MHVKHPDRWCLESKLWTPRGSRLEIKGPIADEVGTLMLALFANPNPTPKERKLILDFAMQFSPKIAEASYRDRKVAAKAAPKKPARKRTPSR